MIIFTDVSHFLLAEEGLGGLDSSHGDGDLCLVFAEAGVNRVTLRHLLAVVPPFREQTQLLKTHSTQDLLYFLKRDHIYFSL